MPTRRAYRLFFAAVIAAAIVSMAVGYNTASASSTAAQLDRSSELPLDERGQVAPETRNVTVVTGDSNVWLRDQGSGPRANSEIAAFNPNGTVLYYNDTHSRYWDVDPSPVGDTTVLYTSSDHMDKQACNASTVCTENAIERVNLTTGEVTRLYSQKTPYKHSTRWHDVDRINDTHFVVADIYRDRVFVVNTETGIVEWQWDAQSHFPLSTGGPFPRDWTHINDVELLEDGRIMVSVRNQDRVVFVDPGEGVQENWTLGAENDYDVLHEQHNPDYIPPERGGPAVLVADSENNRVVEYQRRNGSWERSWTWQDPRQQWPRDADRLPNGNTLISDSNGNRVFEVNQEGDIVWKLDFAFPYEAERLETGDESSNGTSAAELGLVSRTSDASADSPGESGQAKRSTDSTLGRLWLAVKDIVPSRIMNAILYVRPTWVGPTEVVALLFGLSAVIIWGAFEWRWSRVSVDLRWPLRLRRP